MARFNPYADNGGSVVALAGPDFAIVGADTRLSEHYSIRTRELQRLWELSQKTVLAASGCWSDALSLERLVRARMQMYRYEHRKEMSSPALAQMTSTMLYSKRFFPYYVSTALVGLDPEGRGCVYSYDPIGHFERCEYRASGSAGSLMQPLLDAHLGLKNVVGAVSEPLTVDRALAIVKDVFISAAERDIYTGDSVQIKVITSAQVETHTFQLRKD